MRGFISGLFVPLMYLSVLCHNHAVLITVALQSCLKSESIMLPAFFFFPLRIVLAILGICDSI